MAWAVLVSDRNVVGNSVAFETAAVGRVFFANPCVVAFVDAVVVVVVVAAAVAAVVVVEGEVVGGFEAKGDGA